MGWKRDSYKHGLASRGIRTKTMPVRGLLRVDYSNPKEVLFAFWDANERQDYSNFNIDKALDSIQPNIDVLAQESLSNVSLNYEEVIELWEKDKDTAMSLDIFQRDINLIRAFLKLEDRPDTFSEKVLLFDEMIHVEHMDGGIFWDEEDGTGWLFIEELRDEYERKPKYGWEEERSI